MIEIRNGKIITPREVLTGYALLVEQDRIKDIVKEEEVTVQVDEVIDAEGAFIMPGFIDIHSDKIEKIVNPRPTAVFDFELGMKEAEKALLGQGITTIFHSFAMYANNAFGKSVLRKKDNVIKMARLIADLHTRNHLIHHRCHLRIEIDNLSMYDITKELMDENLINEISFMDHTPGQGQYKDIEIYKKSVDYSDGQTFEDIMEFHKNKKKLTKEQMTELAQLAHSRNLTVASHDDDTVEKLMANKEIGVDISEFPITLEVAKKAKEMGFYTVLGAPNILLGGSHSGNLSAADAIKAGCCDILCSDYYPEALLHSIFIMHHQHGVDYPEMVNMVSLNPAKATNIDRDFGSLEAGKKADILFVREYDGYPVITNVFVDGRRTSTLAYRV